jgi:hypothetical protein
MKPLQVVQTLSNNAVATVGMLKKYLGETIERERREIRNVSKLALVFAAIYSSPAFPCNLLNPFRPAH